MAYTEKVIFDTNAVRNNDSSDTFLGGRAELKKFGKVADIIMPEMVIDEIRNQKKKNLISKRDSFLQNIFHKIRNIDEDKTQNFDIDKFISELEQNEEIEYSVIELTDHTSLLPELKSMALCNKPPFDNESDKGFKDAYIYFTILEYLKGVEDKFIYFVTNDGRLKSAFDNNSRVHVVKDFEEFEDYRAGYYKEDYFIDKIKIELDDDDLVSNSVKDIWLNTNDNWAIKIATEDNMYFVEVDFATKEIISSTSADFAKGINSLVNSGNFETTHTHVSKLAKYIPFFSDDDIDKILEAAVTNNQIYWLAEDEDVKVFVKSLFASKIGTMSEESVQVYKEYYG